MLFLGACDKKEVSKVTDKSFTEKTEESTAEIEAAIMMGRNIGRTFVNRAWNDSTELSAHVGKAYAVSHNYRKKNWHKSAAAFDSVLISTVKTVNPDLATPVKEQYSKFVEAASQKNQPAKK